MPQRGELVERRRVLVGQAEHAQAVVELVEPLAVARRPVLLEQLGELRRGRGARGCSARPRRGCASPSGRRGWRRARRPTRRRPPGTRTAACGNRWGTPPRNSDSAMQLTGDGEHADVVEHVVAHRRADRPPHRRGVERRRHAEVDAPLPHRVVVVERVEPERVEPARRARRRVDARRGAADRARRT